MYVEVACSTFGRASGTNERKAWVLPLVEEQLHWLLDIRGVFAFQTTQRDAAYTAYRIAQPLLLATVLRSHLRRQPWLQPLVEAFTTDRNFAGDWEIRVAVAAKPEPPDDSHIDALMGVDFVLVDDESRSSDPALSLEDPPPDLLAPLRWSPSSALEDVPRDVEEDLQSREALFDFGSESLSAAEASRRTGPFAFSSEEIEGVISLIGKE